MNKKKIDKLPVGSKVVIQGGERDGQIGTLIRYQKPWGVHILVAKVQLPDCQFFVGAGNIRPIS